MKDLDVDQRQMSLFSEEGKIATNATSDNHVAEKTAEILYFRDRQMVQLETVEQLATRKVLALLNF